MSSAGPSTSATPPDEESTKKSNDASKILVLDMKRVQQLRCINRRCMHGDNLVPAFRAVCSYYRVTYKASAEVCKHCLKKAMRHYDILGKKMKNRECIFDSHFPNFDAYYVIESDDEDSVTPSPVHPEVVQLMDVAVSKFGEKHKSLIADQIKLCEQYVSQKIEESTKLADEIDEMTNDIQEELNKLQAEIYDPYKPIVSTVPPIDIVDNDTDNKDKDVIAVDEDVIAVDKDVIAVDKDVIAVDKDVIAVESTFCSTPADLPREGPLNYPPIREEQLLFGMKYTLKQPWWKCTAKRIVNEEFVHVKFGNEEKLLSTKEMAYISENIVRFPVGSRVIAKFSDTDTKVVDYFYAGVIAEPPKLINEFRYLIFFDDGYVQYRPHKDIRLVCYKTTKVWNEVHPDSKEFIRSYLEKYPDRKMVKLTNKHYVRAQYQNQWLSAKVLDVDASLVKLYFKESKRCEWLYRGSSRLWNIYEQQSKSVKGIRIRQSGLAYLNKPIVEFTRVEEDPSSPVKSVARKSTSGTTCTTITTVTTSTTSTAGTTSTAVTNSTAVTTSTADTTGVKTTLVRSGEISKPVKQERAFKLTHLSLPVNIIKAKKYITHTCDHSCVEWTNYDYKKTKRLNMLATPLHFGFMRHLAVFNGTQKCVMYHTPCGRRIRNMKEMHDYLMATKNKMTIDQFDYASWVNPLAEFKVLKSLKFLHDLSTGREFRPITCVNNVNNRLPPPMDYLTCRQPMPGVNLNLDSNFLCGCDCTDNCQDKSKCACWQMTIEGQKIIPNVEIDPNIGYNYRRLPERVITGIYECNKTCKCSNTCLNRVVQRPLSQKLQLFMTEKKGWGVRCLNDVPQGSFICIYVGFLYTESDANEGGKNYGDEYLAELDYIEVVEKIKEDYESDVPVSDDENNDSTMNDGDESFVAPDKASSDDDFEIASESTSVISNIATRLRKRQKTKNDMKTTKDGIHIPSRQNASDVINNPVAPKSTREFYGDNESVYIMDAKTSGNIGRYLNHSCNPNTFVQNVFVDTHDLRFPWVSFFALHYIHAGTELTWDYSYDVGSVPGKVMKCHCESVYCRGRLL